MVVVVSKVVVIVPEVVVIVSKVVGIVSKVFVFLLVVVMVSSGCNFSSGCNCFWWL